MLDTLRRGAGSWAAKILLGLLVLSFALWGITDVFRGFGSRTLAEVGGTAVSPEHYQQVFNRELTKLSAQLRQRLTPDMGRRFGLDRQVFAQLVVDGHTRDLGLGLSNAGLEERLRSSPVFHGGDGKFSPSIYAQTLQANGLSEQGFLAAEREEALRQQIYGSLGSGAHAPEALIDAFQRFQREERTLEYFIVPSALATTAAEPGDAALAEFHDGHKREFRAPEYRKLELLVASPTEMKAKIAVSDEDMRKSHAADADRFDSPERRTVQLITFTDKAAAQRAWSEIVAGKDFLEVGKAAGRKQSDIELGSVRQQDVLDDKVAAETFRLGKGAISTPIDGTLATAVVRVLEIEPGKHPSYDEIKDKVRDQLASERARQAIRDVFEEVENERIAGASFGDIAKKLGLKLVVVAAIDRDGKDRDGKTVAEVPSPGSVLKLAFETEVGFEADAVDLGNDGTLWVDVKEVVPERDRLLAEVKDAVKAAYVLDAQAKDLAKRARDLSERAGKGEDLGKLATEIGATFKTSLPMTRTTETADFPPTLLPVAFSLAKGGAGSVGGPEGRIVFRVKEIAAGKIYDDKERQIAGEEVTRAVTNDLAEQYVRAAEKAQGLSVNETLLRQLQGTSDPASP